jgi:hypothetical protein
LVEVSRTGVVAIARGAGAMSPYDMTLGCELADK